MCTTVSYVTIETNSDQYPVFEFIIAFRDKRRLSNYYLLILGCWLKCMEII